MCGTISDVNHVERVLLFKTPHGLIAIVLHISRVAIRASMRWTAAKKDRSDGKIVHSDTM